jgi:hypothetical protein
MVGAAAAARSALELEIPDRPVALPCIDDGSKVREHMVKAAPAPANRAKGWAAWSGRLGGQSPSLASQRLLRRQIRSVPGAEAQVEAWLVLRVTVCSSSFIARTSPVSRSTADRTASCHDVADSWREKTHMLVHLTVVGAALSLLGVWAVCTAVLFYYRRHKIEPVEPGTEAPPAVTKGHAAS